MTMKASACFTVSSAEIDLVLRVTRCNSIYFVDSVFIVAWNFILRPEGFLKEFVYRKSLLFSPRHISVSGGFHAVREIDADILHMTADMTSDSGTF